MRVDCRHLFILAGSYALNRSPVEKRATLALEISRGFLKDVTPEQIELSNRLANNERLLWADQQKAALFSDTTEYMAFLANKNGLEPADFATSINCAIRTTSEFLNPYTIQTPHGGKEMARFMKAHPDLRTEVSNR